MKKNGLSPQEISQKVVIVTEDRPSTLKKMAAQFDFICLDCPKTIGGRFSAFSIVGMLPAIMAGVDPRRIRAGGKSVLDSPTAVEKVKEGASFVFHNLRKCRISQHVSFVYSDKLTFFALWLAQLYAESSGKSGSGITPLTARGSVDQHSQLQLYLDGSKDKCFSFFVEKQICDMIISEDFVPNSFFYLKNKKISDIFEAQCYATSMSIIERNHSVRQISIPEMTPEILGQLFMHFLLEVICVCNLMKVNPFDQPTVERGKNITKELLHVYDTRIPQDAIVG
jgi:glucose-6-phosphate isomerase